MADNRKARLIGWGTAVALVALIATALALGGHHAGSEESGGASGAVASGSGTPAAGGASRTVARGPVPSATAAPAHEASGSAASGVLAQPAVDAVGATRVVKTGTLELQVPRGQVQQALSKLVALTTSMGGYVSQSRTDTVLGSPTGELTLRVPVARFDATVSAAQQVGHVVSLTTKATDVTGRVVDLGARLSALQQTRSTYLTILGRARTIGATLEVQQRVDDVQQQIEETQGELKLLRNQSADATLSISVSQVGAVVASHHVQTGIGAAWHTSVRRFDRGVDAIVSALGPLLLAVIILGVVLGIAGLGYRGVRRVTM